MIYTVTPNPSLDRTLAVGTLTPGSLHRAELVRTDLGGKGINVSRALQALGIPSCIIGFVGGPTGRTLREGLQEDGYKTVFIEVGGDTRQTITLFDRSRGEYTKINEVGPVISQAELGSLQAVVEAFAQPGDFWAFCGSLPPGAPDDSYARLITQVQQAGGRAFLDASGAALRMGMRARPFAIKINDAEAAELLGRILGDKGALALAASEIAGWGVPLTAITCGAEGCVLCMNGECVAAEPQKIVSRSAVGAGDAALAGLLWALVDGCDAEETARRMVACGAAAAAQEGTGVGDLDQVKEIAHMVRVRKVRV